MKCEKPATDHTTWVWTRYCSSDRKTKEGRWFSQGQPVPSGPADCKSPSAPASAKCLKCKCPHHGGWTWCQACGVRSVCRLRRRRVGREQTGGGGSSDEPLRFADCTRLLDELNFNLLDARIRARHGRETAVLSVSFPRFLFLFSKHDHSSIFFHFFFVFCCSFFYGRGLMMQRFHISKKNPNVRICFSCSPAFFQWEQFG